eukprot:COSAG05_NODE_314_length_11610_cov_17.223265_6_plen_53_part_00
MLNGSVPFNFPAALECFRSHYRANPEKLELLPSESAEFNYGSRRLEFKVLFD